jgi:hypothetical protein
MVARNRTDPWLDSFCVLVHIRSGRSPPVKDVNGQARGYMVRFGLQSSGGPRIWSRVGPNSSSRSLKIHHGLCMCVT